ncbi:hypothetical protein DFH06DRAFT_418949 [Mycena polygramma]|nr:hypothetical protein DFH06DRAFT_418949 [Mycena polygramma]
MIYTMKLIQKKTASSSVFTVFALVLRAFILVIFPTHAIESGLRESGGGVCRCSGLSNGVEATRTQMGGWVNILE